MPTRLDDARVEGVEVEQQDELVIQALLGLENEASRVRGLGALLGVACDVAGGATAAATTPCPAATMVVIVIVHAVRHIVVHRSSRDSLRASLSVSELIGYDVPVGCGRALEVQDSRHSVLLSTYLRRWNSWRRRYSIRSARAPLSERAHRLPETFVSCFVSGRTCGGWGKARPVLLLRARLPGWALYEPASET